MVARRGNLMGATALVVALVALTVAIFGVAYHREVGTLRADAAQIDASTADIIGLNNQAAKNALDPRYKDADGDLVADAPTDPAQQLDPPTLTFSYIDDADTYKDAFKELMATVSAATGKPVHYVAYDNTADKLRDLRDGRLSFCGVTTGSVPLAVCTAGFVPLVEAADAKGQVGSPMKIIVPADSTLSTLNDIRGHRLTVTEANSNSGYKAPLVLLREHGMVPLRDYGLSFSYGHIPSIARVKGKQADAAAVSGEVLQIEEASGHISPADYRVIYTSDQLFPSAAIGCASDLKPQLIAKIKAALLAFDWKGTGMEKRGLFTADGKVKFAAADYKRDWEYVRRIDESFGYAYTLPPAKATTQPTTRMASIN